MRIYELAKELGINKKDLVAKVRNLGFPVSNFMSPIDPDSISRIRSHMDRERQANIEQVQVSKGMFRRRRKDRPAGEDPGSLLESGNMGSGGFSSGPEYQSSSAALDVGAEPKLELNAEERFKIALEAELRQHLGRSPVQDDEGSSVTDAFRPRPKKGRGASGDELSRDGERLDDERNGESYSRSDNDGFDAHGEREREREGRFSSGLRGLARGAGQVTPHANVEVPLFRLQGEAAVPPVRSEDEVRVTAAAGPSVLAASERDAAGAAATVDQGEQEQVKPQEGAGSRETPSGEQGLPAEPGALPERPRQIRRPERSTAQEAVVVAIPSQEERERRLGLSTQAKAAQAKGKKGKTVFTRQDVHKDIPFGSNRRVSKKKASKAVSAVAPTVLSEHKRIIRIEDTISVSELAQRMSVKAGDVIKALLMMGTKVSITQSLDADTAALVASEFKYEVKNVAFQEEQVLEETAEERDEDVVVRAPVITMMGHVDHGKTSLLDKIRQTKVAQGEAGGITQHIGAYNVTLEDGSRIVFLDTPGHEAFTAMRARGAQATDIVILVVAANDGVMPQTVEAINHAKDAEVPIIVAINKVDLPGANPDRVKQMLTEHGLVTEEWGGDTMMVPVSAKTGQGIDELLDSIRVQAEVMELRANPNRRGSGLVLEASLESGRGPVATILVQHGTVSVGDILVAGSVYGKVRAMSDERGRRLKLAEPSTPIEVVGLNDVPNSGDQVNVVQDEKAARSLVEHRTSQQRRSTTTTLPGSSAGRDLTTLFGTKSIKEVKLIIKCDVHGSVEAVREALLRLTTEDVKVAVIHEGVGGVTEGDVMLASAAAGKGEDTEVAIIAFNVRAKPRVIDLAASHGVRIKTYTIIYDAIEETKGLMAGMLAPITREKYLGRAEVREIYTIPKVGTISGCAVQDGKIKRGTRVRLLRNEVIVWEGKLSSLRRFKDDVREVTQGFECGIGLENFNDVHLQDIIEAYETEEVAAEL
ncbi:MAG: translation initiation factor IF-2 [Myxococcota bacterium]|jgi:translation initiation factor IF-2|nr:translation initiation factor IF-2 [Myxococcota bacterium]